MIGKEAGLPYSVVRSLLTKWSFNRQSPPGRLLVVCLSRCMQPTLPWIYYCCKMAYNEVRIFVERWVFWYGYWDELVYKRLFRSCGSVFDVNMPFKEIVLNGKTIEWRRQQLLPSWSNGGSLFNQMQPLYTNSRQMVRSRLLIGRAIVTDRGQTPAIAWIPRDGWGRASDGWHARPAEINAPPFEFGENSRSKDESVDPSSLAGHDGIR